MPEIHTVPKEMLDQFLGDTILLSYSNTSTNIKLVVRTRIERVDGKLVVNSYLAILYQGDKLHKYKLNEL